MTVEDTSGSAPPRLGASTVTLKSGPQCLEQCKCTRRIDGNWQCNVNQWYFLSSEVCRAQCSRLVGGVLKYDRAFCTIETEEEPCALFNISTVSGTAAGATGTLPLRGSFGATRPPTLIDVAVSDADNGDEVYGYCDEVTFTFDMATDKAGRPDIDVMELRRRGRALRA